MIQSSGLADGVGRGRREASREREREAGRVSSIHPSLRAAVPARNSCGWERRLTPHIRFARTHPLLCWLGAAVCIVIVLYPSFLLPLNLHHSPLSLHHSLYPAEPPGPSRRGDTTTTTTHPVSLSSVRDPSLFQVSVLLPYWSARFYFHSHRSTVTTRCTSPSHLSFVTRSRLRHGPRPRSTPPQKRGPPIISLSLNLSHSSHPTPLRFRFSGDQKLRF